MYDQEIARCRSLHELFDPYLFVLKFSQNRLTFSILSGFVTSRLLSICISAALSEWKLLAFGRGISSRNSHNSEIDLMDHGARRVQELCGQIG
jgi:hypothetical protein